MTALLRDSCSEEMKHVTMIQNELTTASVAKRQMAVLINGDVFSLKKDDFGYLNIINNNRIASCK